MSEVAGLAGRESMYQLSDCIAQRDASGAMQIISELYQNSFDMERLCVEMINHFRNFLVVKTVRKSRELIVCTDDEYDMILESSKKYSIENIVYALDLFQSTLVTIKGGANARIEVEMAFVKLCEPKLEESMASVLDRISALEKAVKNGISIADIQQSSPVPSVKPEAQAKEEIEAEPMPQTEAEEEKAPVVDAPEPAQPKPQPTQTDSNQTVEFMQWGDFMDCLHNEDIPLFGLLSSARGYTRGEFFLIDSPNPAVRDFIKLPIHSKSIKKALLEVTGKQYKLGLFKRQTEQTEQKRDPLEDLINQASGVMNIEIK